MSESENKLNEGRKFCRLCLGKTSSVYSSLLELNASSMLYSLTSIKVVLDGKTSTLMCQQCEANLKTAYGIQQYMINSDKQLQNGLFPQVKDEEANNESDDNPLINNNGPTDVDTSDKKCDQCDKSFPTTGKLNTHKLDHDRMAKDKCPICQKMLTIRYLQDHINFHNGIGHMCEFCGRTFPASSYLKTHIRTKHQGILPKCEECGKIFNRNSIRDAHVRRIHKGEPLDICPLCGKKFYNTGALKTHMDSTHLNKKVCACEYCGKEFKKPESLKMHVRIHTNERPYKCEFCGKGFIQNVQLKGHKKSQHNFLGYLDFKCQTCGKGFATDFALTIHTRIHL